MRDRFGAKKSEVDDACAFVFVFHAQQRPAPNAHRAAGLTFNVIRTSMEAWGS